MRNQCKLIIAMLIFGSIGLFVRYLDMPSSTIALIRGLIGTTILFSYQRLHKNSFSKTAMKLNLKVLLASGTAIGLNWILLFEAYRYTTISVATLCYYFAPVIVILLSPIILKEKLGKVQLISVFLSILGMVFVAGVLQNHETGKSNLVGILFGLSAAVLYASVIILNKFIKDMNSMDSTITQLGVATIVLLPYVVLTGNLTKLFENTELKSIAILLIIGIVHTGFAYLLYFSSMRGLKGQTVAIFSYIDPVTAILLSTCILGEKMGILQGVGAVLILGATIYSELNKGKQVEIIANKINRK